jgi:hypothetical protein
MAVVRRRPLHTIRGAAPERGVCTVCGREHPLAFTTGMVKRHRVGGEPCPGGARPPAESKAEQTVRTDERL